MMLIEWIHAMTDDMMPSYLTSDAPEFSDLGGLVDAGDFAAISDMNESLMQKGIYDIRFMIYALYHDLAEDRFSSLSMMLETMLLMLERWPQLGPEKKRDKYAKSSIVWIFRQFMVDVRTLELSSETTLALWHAVMDAEALQVVRDQVTQLRRWFSTNLEASLADAVQAPLTEMTDWLSAYELALPRPEAANMADESGDQDGNVQDGDDQRGDAALQGVSQTGKSSGGQTAGSAEVFGSRYLDELNRKIQTFQLLASRGEMLKAAIVVSDIAQILEAFDARKYLPTLFSPYFETLAQNVYGIAEMQEHNGSPHWLVLNDLYTTDLDKFTALKVDL
ncbi:MAG: hypothetical protein RIQ52_647 [Pseudomonadota bacterium]